MKNTEHTQYLSSIELKTEKDNKIQSPVIKKRLLPNAVLHWQNF